MSDEQVVTESEGVSRELLDTVDLGLAIEGH